MEKAIAELKLADENIKKRTRYFCGLLDDEEAKELKEGGARFFFVSPDYQNGELYSEFTSMGWKEVDYQAPYLWKIKKEGIVIEFIEGDIYFLVDKTFRKESEL